MKSIEVLSILKNYLFSGRSVLIHQCNALTGIGLWEALDSLTSNLLLTRNQNELLETNVQDSIRET